jgi:hypothetical protein
MLSITGGFARASLDHRLRRCDAFGIQLRKTGLMSHTKPTKPWEHFLPGGTSATQGDVTFAIRCLHNLSHGQNGTGVSRLLGNR